jgi:hypothetical protein
MDVRHKVSVKTIITNEDGKETAGAEIFLGEMKLEDVKKAESVLLTEVPKIFLGMLQRF